MGPPLSYNPVRSRLASLAACALLLPLACCPTATGAEEVIDSPMYKTPAVPMPPVVEGFPTKAPALWLRALEQPDTELQRKAAEAFTRARRRGIKGLEGAVGPLLATLERPDQHPAVRLAAAEALIALDARRSAAALWRQAQAGESDLRELVEPALARWDHQPVRDAWLARLGDPVAGQRGLVLAMQGLATVQEGRAVPLLRALVLAPRRPSPLRLEAARALGALLQEGLEKDAEQLAADPSPGGRLGRLAAASLLQRHSSVRAIQLLQRLGKDADPAVTALAARRLVEIDTKLTRGILGDLIANPDVAVWLVAVEILRKEPTNERVGRLAELLADAHPDVRARSRRSLRELAARKEFRAKVLAEATQRLDGAPWQAAEQAVILLTELDHKPAAGRFVGLLPAGRPEVFVTAAWGLRKLAVAETVPAVHRFLQRRLEQLLAGERVSFLLFAYNDHQLSQLNQLLGQQRYAPSEATLRKFIPKRMGVLGAEARSAAVWALGRLHEGKPVPELVTALEERMKDMQAIPPEFPNVRYMSAVGLGQMKAKSAAATLRMFAPERKFNLSPVNNACTWALARILNEPLPAVEAVSRGGRDWFLVPVD